MAKDQTLYVTFLETSANFYGKVKSDDAMVDMLLMVLTYAPPGKRPQAPVGAHPRDVTLLPNYKHEKQKGIDSSVGVISKEGFGFSYDIGGRGTGSAAKSLAKEDTTKWYKEQVVDGRPVHLALTKERLLYISLPESRANFSGKVKADEDLLDMLLITLTSPQRAK
jgi:hypothetical protein